jgi:hypothetical protein
MNELILLNTATQSPRYLVNRSISWGGFVLIALACFGFLMTAQAAPDGDVGNGSTAEGAGALSSLSSGLYNTALGLQTLFRNTSGGYNTATGVNALYSNTTGSYNTATGLDALYSNTTGSSNTATGDYAFFSNTTGSNNTATGVDALYSNTIGFRNTAAGDDALFNNSTGGLNTANGSYALFYNTNGGGNTATGDSALYFNTTGSSNTATGAYALFSNTTGSNNIALGDGAGRNLVTGDNNIYIANGNNAGQGFSESNTIRIGDRAVQTATYIAGIRGTTTLNADALPVVIDSSGQLGTMSSSRRFKDEIKPMNQSSEAILELKPVVFHYKNDRKGTPQFGLIAEEVAEVNPDLVMRDAEGKVFTVRYEAVNAMLLNEFLKAHKKIDAQDRKAQEQEGTITQLKITLAQQQKGMDLLAANMKEQAAQIQKVSAQLEMGKTTPQLVDNNQ